MAGAGNEGINGYLEAILDSGAGAGGSRRRRSMRCPRVVVLGATSTQPGTSWRRWSPASTRPTSTAPGSRSSPPETPASAAPASRTCAGVSGTSPASKSSWNGRDNRGWLAGGGSGNKGSWMLRRTCRRTCPRGRRETVFGELLVQIETTPRKQFHRNLSNLEVWSDDKKEKKLYLVLISLHGLVCGDYMELGRDSGTGGQVKYVVELARALARLPGVYRVLKMPIAVMWGRAVERI